VETLCGQAYGAQKYEMLRRIFVKINRSPHFSRCPPQHHIHLLQAHPNISRPVAGNCFGRRSFRLRPNPTNLRIRSKLPHPKISPGSKHSDAKRIYISSHASYTPFANLGGSLQDSAWVVGGIVGAELFMVDYSGGTVCVYSEK